MTSIALCCVLAWGCKRSEPEETRTPAPETEAEAEAEQELPARAPAPQAGTANGSSSEPKTPVDGIPTEEDFEPEAEQTITPDNLEAELDKLEAEITPN
jgi:hypothetical protein